MIVLTRFTLAFNWMCFFAGKQLVPAVPVGANAGARAGRLKARGAQGESVPQTGGLGDSAHAATSGSPHAGGAGPRHREARAVQSQL